MIERMAKVGTWVLLVFFAFAVVGIVVSRPGATVLGAANLVPFGLALIAFRPDSRPVAAWAALLVNSAWFLLYVGVGAVVLLEGVSQPILVSILCAAVALPCLANSSVLWGRVRSTNAG
jgi:hypothetical protein